MITNIFKIAYHDPNRKETIVIESLEKEIKNKYMQFRKVYIYSEKKNMQFRICEVKYLNLSSEVQS